MVHHTDGDRIWTQAVELKDIITNSAMLVRAAIFEEITDTGIVKSC